jgi:hypothetical protein
MQASAESRVTRPPHARLRMQAKLAPPTVLVRKAELLNTLKAPDSRKDCFGGTNTVRHHVPLSCASLGCA